MVPNCRIFWERAWRSLEAAAVLNCSRSPLLSPANAVSQKPSRGAVGVRVPLHSSSDSRHDAMLIVERSVAAAMGAIAAAIGAHLSSVCCCSHRCYCCSHRSLQQQVTYGCAAIDPRRWASHRVGCPNCEAGDEDRTPSRVRVYETAEFGVNRGEQSKTNRRFRNLTKTVSGFIARFHGSDAHFDEAHADEGSIAAAIGIGSTAASTFIDPRLHSPRRDGMPTCEASNEDQRLFRVRF